MKKLALALVCFASVAFFASCQPDVTNPEPSIVILSGDGYVQDNQVVDVATYCKFGFKVASNSQTQQLLSSLKVYVDDTEWANIDLTDQSEFSYTDTVFYTYNRDSIVGRSEIKAIVTDAAGKTNTKTINLKINLPDQPLTVTDFDWYRLGSTQSGLEEYGLYWYQNAKAPFAQIKPKDNVVLYKFDSQIWDRVVTENQKASAFSDGAVTISMYNNVDVNQNGMYNDVIGTRMPDGTLHLLHVTSCVIGAQQSAGRPIHIYGNAK